MDAAWRLESASVRDMLDAIGGETQSAYTTIMTVMMRLTEKGLLARKPRGKAYVYHPRITRQAYAEGVSRSRVRGLLKDFGDLAVSQFAEELRDFDPDRARQLAELLRKGRGE